MASKRKQARRAAKAAKRARKAARRAAAAQAVPQRARGGGSGRSSAPVAIVMVPEQRQAKAPAPRERGKSMASRNLARRAGGAVVRGGKALVRRAAEADYRRLASDVGLQVACEVSEGLAGLLNVALDTVAANSKTTADDTAMPWIKKAGSTAVRVLAGRVLAKNHPGFAMVVSAGASALSGATYSTAIQKQGLITVTRAAERLQQSETER